MANFYHLFVILAHLSMTLSVFRVIIVMPSQGCYLLLYFPFHFLDTNASNWNIADSAVHQSLEIARESVWDAKGYPVYSGWQWYCLETAVLLDHLTGPNRRLVNTVTVTLELEPSKVIWYQFGRIFVTFTMAGPEYPEYDIVHRIYCFHGNLILTGTFFNFFIFLLWSV